MDRDQFYLSKEEPHRSCLLSLRDIILAQDARLKETRKYGMPCFTLGKKPCCYLWTDKKTAAPYILFVDGQKLQHPALESGERKRMSILHIAPDQDLDIQTITTILDQAIQWIDASLT